MTTWKSDLTRHLFFSGVIGVSLTLAACLGGGGSSGGSNSGGAVSGASFSGPGSKWDFTLADDGSFHVDHRPNVSASIDLTVDGTYQRLASGFLKMTVGSASGTDAPSSGDQSWALEVPGYALMVKPMDSNNDQMIAMVKSGVCPQTDIDANWVVVKQDDSADATNPGRDYFGTFHFDTASGTPSLPSMYSLADPLNTLGTGTISSGICTDGVISVSDAVMYLTDNGGAIVHTGTDDADETDDHFIFALNRSAITNVNNLDGNYAGMLFNSNEPAGSRILPVALSCTTGTCVGNLVDDIDTGALSVESVTVNLSGGVDTPSDGFISGTITDASASTGNMVCMTDSDAAGTGKKVINCVGQSPGMASNMFNILLVSI
jgi:hypothetical protein